MQREFIKKLFSVSDSVLDIIEKCEEQIAPSFKRVEEIAQINQLKVMKAFYDNRVSETYFAPSTGYGYGDLGRDTLDKVYAQVFEAEDALVRHNFISGTHTLSTMLFSVLRPGDTLAAVTGKPYDTLEEVIGIVGEVGNGSLADFGISYEQVNLLDGEPDYDKIKALLQSKKIKAAMIQRSKGYEDRPAFSSSKIGDIIKFIKEISPETIVLVDNCYGEFADVHEPTYYGADLMAGSLIKNPGGGLAPCGGYIAGKAKYIELCANRLTSVGVGREGGATFGLNRELYQGFFMAPHTVSQAIKSAILCSSVYTHLGFEVSPKPTENRYDIIQDIRFGSPELITAFCRGIQKGAPIDSFIKPEPCSEPGYQSQVIMAAGAFVQGASIELSADAPMREPYIVYMQGGLTYESAKFGIIMSLLEVEKQLEKSL